MSKFNDCEACFGVEVDHTEKCLKEFEYVLDTGRVDVSLTQMRLWVSELSNPESLYISQIISEMRDYIELVGD